MYAIQLAYSHYHPDQMALWHKRYGKKLLWDVVFGIIKKAKSQPRRTHGKGRT